MSSAPPKPAETLLVFSVADLGRIYGLAIQDPVNSILSVDDNLRVEVTGAIGAQAVAKTDVGPFLDVVFDFVPETLVITNFMAMGANGEQTLQSFHLGQGGLQLLDQGFLFLV